MGSIVPYQHKAQSCAQAYQGLSQGWSNAILLMCRNLAMAVILHHHQARSYALAHQNRSERSAGRMLMCRNEHCANSASASRAASRILRVHGQAREQQPRQIMGAVIRTVHLFRASFEH